MNLCPGTKSEDSWNIYISISLEREFAAISEMHGISNSLREKGHYHISHQRFQKLEPEKNEHTMLHVGKDLHKKSFDNFLISFQIFCHDSFHTIS